MQAPVPAPPQMSTLTATFDLLGVSAPLNQSASSALLSAVNQTLSQAGVAANVSLGTVTVRPFLLSLSISASTSWLPRAAHLLLARHKQP